MAKKVNIEKEDTGGTFKRPQRGKHTKKLSVNVFGGIEEGLKVQTLLFDIRRGGSELKTMETIDIAEVVGCTYTDVGDVSLDINSGTNLITLIPIAPIKSDPEAIPFDSIENFHF